MARNATNYRFVASGPALVGVVNDNLVHNFREDDSARVTLPALRDLAKTIVYGNDFMDVTVFDVENDTP